MSAPQFVSESLSQSRGTDWLLAGSKCPTLYLVALPAVVVALAATGTAQLVTGIIVVAWFALLPLALYARRAAIALPVVAAGFMILTLVTLPFNSAAFVVDIWTSAAMFFLSLPRRTLKRI
jgi:hypothetical protein